jgi:hypothetical protein
MIESMKVTGDQPIQLFIAHIEADVYYYHCSAVRFSWRKCVQNALLVALGTSKKHKIL